jgi:BioD-like phosphotransacetylase family protein
MHALITNVFGLDVNAEEMTIGFEHAKLKYMYDAQGMKDKLAEMAASAGDGKDVLWVEAGESLAYGASVNLDAISLASYLQAKLVLVAGGSESTIVDDLAFVKRYVDLKNVDFAGVIVNKVRNLEDYRSTHLDDVTALGVKVLGVVPFDAELTKLSVGHLAERLLAKVIAGEDACPRRSALSWWERCRQTSPCRILSSRRRTSSSSPARDRSDLILAAIESSTAGIILTNNILPSSNITSMASERKIPLLLVPFDTYQTASQIESIDPLLVKDDSRKMEILTQLVKDHIATGDVIG